MSYKITPSLMTSDLLKLDKEINDMISAGIDWIHFDLMDGKYVDNLGLTPGLIDDIKLKYPQITIDAHCMVNDIQNIINILKKADYVTIHYSSKQKTSIKETLELIKNNNIKVGLAIDLNDDINEVSVLLKGVDLLTLMSIKPGFAGQKFNDKTWDNIKYFNNFRIENKLNYLIQIDGGVRDENIVKLIKSNVDLIVVGSWLFSKDNYKQRLEDLRILVSEQN